MSRSDLHRLVDDLPEDAVEGATTILQRITLRHINPEQAWFWTPEWQAKEREADRAIAAGEVERYESDETFLAAIDEMTNPS